MTKYAEIIERLEDTDGPDRWLDARIDAALRIGSLKMQGQGYNWAWDNFPNWRHHLNAAGMCGVMHENGDLGLIWDSQPFTASIDAAIALVERVLPKAARITTMGDDAGLACYCRFVIFPNGLGEEDGKIDVCEWQHSFPLAIMLSLFRALEAQEAKQ